MFITFLVLIALFPPRCLGYWHGLLCFQCFPKEWRCFGHIIISLSLVETGNSKIPALVRISSYSVNLSQDKWHEFKWLEMLSVQSSSKQILLHLSKHHMFLYTSINWTKSTLTPSLLIYGSSPNKINKLLIDIWRLH